MNLGVEFNGDNHHEIIGRDFKNMHVTRTIPINIRALNTSPYSHVNTPLAEANHVGIKLRDYEYFAVYLPFRKGLHNKYGVGSWNVYSSAGMSASFINPMAARQGNIITHEVCKGNKYCKRVDFDGRVVYFNFSRFDFSTEPDDKFNEINYEAFPDQREGVFVVFGHLPNVNEVKRGMSVYSADKKVVFHSNLTYAKISDFIVFDDKLHERIADNNTEFEGRKFHFEDNKYYSTFCPIPRIIVNKPILARHNWDESHYYGIYKYYNVLNLKQDKQSSEQWQSKSTLVGDYTGDTRYGDSLTLLNTPIIVFDMTHILKAIMANEEAFTHRPINWVSENGDINVLPDGSFTTDSRERLNGLLRSDLK